MNERTALFARWLAGLLVFALGCARPAPASPEAISLGAADGGERSLAALTASAPFTVVVFVSADCPCLDAHLERLRALHAAYAPRGVQFFAVDSEVSARRENLEAQRAALGLPFPVLLDARARLADRFGAEYATFSVLLDRRGRVLYRGGIDSDKRKLHDDATPYLREALDDVLAGAPPRRAEGKALGCVLRKW